MLGRVAQGAGICLLSAPPSESELLMKLYGPTCSDVLIVKSLSINSLI